ncbi:MAG: hypothetical protein GY832_19370 [Chloroflexi bacterium]|nr:hypothetical protein [Chloroflexota bacterium]
MNRSRRSSLTGGMILILLGAWFLAVQLVPGLQNWFSWPWIIIGVGILMLLGGLLGGVPDMAVPGCIVGGIGGILYWQNATGNWDSWAYIWSLIPGFVGVGIILSGLFGGKLRKSLREGGNLILTSLIMFIIFGAFLGGPNLLGDYWPVLLILLGLWTLIRPFFRSR